MGVNSNFYCKKRVESGRNVRVEWDSENKRHEGRNDYQLINMEYLSRIPLYYKVLLSTGSCKYWNESTVMRKPGTPRENPRS